MKRSPFRFITSKNAIFLFAILFFIHLVTNILVIKDEWGLTVFNDAASPIESLLAAAALLWGARRSAIYSRRLFIAWGIVALAQLAWTVGDVIWLVLEVGLRRAPFPSVAGVFYLLYFALFMWGILRLPMTRATKSERLTLSLDVGIVAIVAGLTFWYFWIAPFLQMGETDLLTLVLLLVYPVFDLLLLVTLFLVLSRLSEPQARIPVQFLAASIALKIVIDAIYAYQSDAGTYSGGGIVDTGWAAGVLLAGLAGAIQAGTVEESTSAATKRTAAARGGSAAGTWVAYTPYVWLGAAYLFLIISYGRDLVVDFYTLVLWVGVIVGLVVIRQIMAIVENRRLLEDQRRIDEALRESEEKYRIVVEHADEGIVVVQEGLFTYLNRAAYAISGYTPNELVGRPFVNLIHPDDRAELVGESERRLSGDELASLTTYRIMTKDGSVRWVIGSGTLISWAGRPAVLGYVRDVTDDKKAEQAEQVRVQRVIRYQKTLLKLARLDTSSLDSVFKKITEVVGTTLQVERAGIWLFEQDHGELVLKDLFKRSDASHDEGTRLTSANYPRYFAELDESRIIAAHDAVADKRTREFADGYLIPLGITSMMDIPIRLRGAVVGVLCHEHTGSPREWTIEDQEFAASVADTISLALEACELNKAKEALYESEERYRYLFENSLDAVFTVDLKGNFTSVNRTVEGLSGYTRDELIGKSYREFVSPEAAEYIFQTYNRLFCTGEPLISVKYTMITKGGEERTVEGYANLIKKGDAVAGFQGTLRDITDRLKLEQQLTQAQKMEAVGAMAGGIAHNFNNIMVGIMGYSEFLLTKKTGDDPDYKALKIIHEGTLRASELTKQLLNISRSAQYNLITINLNHLINKVMPLIAGTFDKSILIKTHLAPDLPAIEGDISQLEQCLLNLCINARDAMPQGGRLTIETNNHFLDEDFVRSHLGAESGPHVVMTVTDTGIGITPEIREHIFEPFFTTKEDSGGTGMGLATVYGIMRSHNGFITVYSEVNCGSTFKLYFPAAKSRFQEIVDNQETGKRPGTETILLIDDEPVVREMWGDFLTQKGYRVIVAENGLTGLELFATHKEEIDLVILDLIMPKLGGKESLISLREIDPSVKILVTSGYSENGQAGEIVRLGIDGFLQKPVQLTLLERKITEILKK